jgi:hypothetical protein
MLGGILLFGCDGAGGSPTFVSGASDTEAEAKLYGEYVTYADPGPDHMGMLLLSAGHFVSMSGLRCPDGNPNPEQCRTVVRDGPWSATETAITFVTRNELLMDQDGKIRQVLVASPPIQRSYHFSDDEPVKLVLDADATGTPPRDVLVSKGAGPQPTDTSTVK